VLTHFDWMLQPLRLQWHGSVSDEQQRGIGKLGAVNVAVSNADALPVSEPGEADVHGDVETVDGEPGDASAVAEQSVVPPVTEGRWISRDELDSVGVPAPIRKLLDAML
jgi:hypothetical protein